MLSLVFPGFFGADWDTVTPKNPFTCQLQEPVISFSGSEDSTPKTHSSNSNSDQGSPSPSQIHQLNQIYERKRRRTISNRESARRSRMRKQKHLENLRNQVNRHKSGNHELRSRLRFVSQHGQVLEQENERLRSESVMLRQKLWDIHQVLLVRQLQNHLLSTSAWNGCNNNVTSINEQNPPSLIT